MNHIHTPLMNRLDSLLGDSLKHRLYIYRSVGILPSPVPYFEAFACPPFENEQRRKPTPICKHQHISFQK
ncbi:MAG: hypothetical protein LUF90_00220 [Rikenellaceae bacterium]|nr:hypothetical protein [Rikenellaceae bacterium]